MGACSISFRWLELLEKEFDNSVVDLDLLLGDIEEEQSEITFAARERLKVVCAAFAQLTHKSQTIFQSNAKLEVGTVGR